MASGPHSTFTCRLYRDGIQTPWGFRLQGGKDFNQPLTVQRVFTGSPAEGELQRGDVIIKINNTDVNPLTHKQAQDILKTPAGQLVLNIQRGQTRFSPQKSQQSSQFAPSTPTQGFRSVPFEGNPAPKPFNPPSGGHQQPQGVMNFGQDYNRMGSPSRQPMIHRVADSLDNVIWQQRSADDGMDDQEDYNYGSVQDRKKHFSQDNPSGPIQYHPVKDNVRFYHATQFKYGKPVVHAPGRPGRTGKVWRPPPQTHMEKPRDFGWTPTKHVQPGYIAGPPSQEQPQRSYTPPPKQHTPVAPSRPHFVSHAQEGGSPAWKGTLRAPGSGPAQVVPAPRSVQFSPHSPSTMPHPKPSYQQRHPAPQHVEQKQAQHDGPKVVHLQYNSPMGLYSRQNIDETLQGQTRVSSGAGDKNLDYTKSHTWQMLQQTGGAPGGGGQQQTDTTQYQAQQSRSFRALEQDLGATDF